MAAHALTRRPLTTTTLALGAFLAAFAVWTAPPAQAATFIVTRFDDPSQRVPPRGLLPPGGGHRRQRPGGIGHHRARRGNLHAVDPRDG
ncbi:MAG: hypothetical protein ACRDH8_03290 [Actinomycetota bacterium]